MRTAVWRILAVAFASLAMLPALAAAQDHTWRHGIVEANSDAGFQVMAVRGGFVVCHDKQDVRSHPDLRSAPGPDGRARC